MSNIINYKQEYLDACIYKVHKTDKWAELYEKMRLGGFNMTPKESHQYIDDEIDEHIDLEFQTYKDVPVIYTKLFTALDMTDCHIFMDGENVFTVHKKDILQFSYAYRLNSNRVDDKIILIEIVPINSPQKLLLFANKDANKNNIKSIILTRLGIKEEKISFITGKKKIYIYIDIITISHKERENITNMLSYNKIAEPSNDFDDEFGNDNNIVEDIINFNLPEIKSCSDKLYYTHPFSSNLAKNIPSDFRINGKLKSNFHDRFYQELKSRILIEDIKDKDKMATTMVFNYNNCVINQGKETNISNITNDEKDQNTKLKLLGLKICEDGDQLDFGEMREILKKNGFNTNIFSDSATLIKKMGFIKVNRKYIHKDLPKKN
jgi:hypothetical protein